MIPTTNSFSLLYFWKHGTQGIVDKSPLFHFWWWLLLDASVVWLKFKQISRQNILKYVCSQGWWQRLVIPRGNKIWEDRKNKNSILVQQKYNSSMMILQ